MDQHKIKNMYENNRKFINRKYKFQCIYFVLAYNRAEIAKHCTKLELFYDYFHTRF